MDEPDRGFLQHPVTGGGGFESVARLRGAISKFIAAYYERIMLFEWNKTCVNPKHLQKLYSNYINEVLLAMKITD